MKEDMITFKEFRSWITGLVIGKRGAIPDLADWKLIKDMMDRVVTDNDPEDVIGKDDVKENSIDNDYKITATQIKNQKLAALTPPLVSYAVDRCHDTVDNNGRLYNGTATSSTKQEDLFCLDDWFKALESFKCMDTNYGLREKILSNSMAVCTKKHTIAYNAEYILPHGKERSQEYPETITKKK